jgi:DNA-nicking Smr family endonuclease
MKKLDLHKTFHEDAERKTIRFIEESWGSGEEVEIITGNSQVMKGLVINILNEYGLTYQIGRLFDLNNKGYIVTLIE